jgi:hypothetical protein
MYPGFTMGKLSREESLTRLIEAQKSQQLVLVLGAGVSLDYGAPSWNTLLHKLMVSRIQGGEAQPTGKNLIMARLFQEIVNPEPTMAARYLRGTTSPGGGFESEVQRVLYEDLRTDRSSRVFPEIGRLFVNPTKLSLHAVITYNYDDLLEQYLRDPDVGIPCCSIYKAGQKPAATELPVYHVHGYLPQGDALESNSVLLGEGDYHEQYSNPYTWQNLTQIEKFANYTCLFIGLSFTDPNLRRLLDIARQLRTERHHQHFLIRRKHTKEEIAAALEKVLASNPDLAKEKAAEEMRFEGAAEGVLQLMIDFEHRDAQSFGVETVWVDNYSEIPQLLRAIARLDPVAIPAAVAAGPRG